MDFTLTLSIILIAVIGSHQSNATFKIFNSSSILIPNGKLTENEIIKISATTQLNKVNSKNFQLMIHDNININNSKYIVKLSTDLNHNILMSYYYNGIWTNLHSERFSQQYSHDIEFIVQLKKYEIQLTINSERSYSFEYNTQFEISRYMTINASFILENVIFGRK